MQQNELVLRTWELVHYGTFNGLPLEECEYKEILDFYMELWEYIMNLAAKAMETIAQMIEKAAKSLNDFADYLENKPPRAVVVVVTDSNGICKCGSARGLTKYKGKYYCANCLDKKLRW